MDMPAIILSPTSSGSSQQLQAESTSTVHAPAAPDLVASDNWADCEEGLTLAATSAESHVAPANPALPQDAEAPPPLQVGAAPPPPPPAQNTAAASTGLSDRPSHEPSKRPRNVVNYKKYF
ncbi:transcription initiation factor TFIID subunit 4-like [Cydia fagiglandana]|uniref:transcription initiation factor TFIID subunit 4-like n=1 Tax=Cydia fagiglandana TaxID=1458189 RepID=UPI002FEDFF8D